MTKKNPYAICTVSVGRDDKKKYKRCVKSVKKQDKMSEGLPEVVPTLSLIHI